MAHALINSAPLALGIDQTDERRRMARKVLEISRALIGNRLADELRFPNSRTVGMLRWYRLRTRYNSLMDRYAPALATHNRFDRFMDLLKTATFEEHGISYRLPNQVYSERSHRW